MSGGVRLAELRGTPLSVEELTAAVCDDAAGGTAVFVGTVRNHDGGRAVTSLTYDAHPSAAGRLAEVAAAVAVAHPGTVVAAVHRFGELRIGDLAVVVAASAAHREEAFLTARELIDEVKAQVPIWKHQQFADGGSEWVGVATEAP